VPKLIIINKLKRKIKKLGMNNKLEGGGKKVYCDIFRRFEKGCLIIKQFLLFKIKYYINISILLI